MKFKQIKEALLTFEDFYGQDIADREAIRKARSKKQLLEVIQRHKHFLETQSIDANTHIDSFIDEVFGDFLLVVD